MESLHIFLLGSVAIICIFEAVSLVVSRHGSKSEVRKLKHRVEILENKVDRPGKPPTTDYPPFR